MIRSVSTVLLCGLLAACATAQRQQGETAPPVTLPPAPPPGEPAGIAGLEAAQLKIMFGAPSFVRKDGKSEMWRYDTAACRAFFFLYQDAAGGRLNVRHAETIPRGRDMAADSGCLDVLRLKPAAPAPVS